MITLTNGQTVDPIDINFCPCCGWKIQLETYSMRGDFNYKHWKDFDSRLLEKKDAQDIIKRGGEGNG